MTTPHGLVIGKFYPPHEGHHLLISTAAAVCERVTVLVLSHEVESIPHALRVTVRSTNGYVWPASHRAGSTPGALPLGARLRLKQSKDLSGYPAYIRNIFRGLQTHGLIVADNGSDLYVTGATDARWNNNELNPAFGSLRGDDFEVVQLGWR